VLLKLSPAPEEFFSEIEHIVETGEQVGEYFGKAPLTMLDRYAVCQSEVLALAEAIVNIQIGSKGELKVCSYYDLSSDCKGSCYLDYGVDRVEIIE
jgi:hypothetical protein